MVAAPLLTLALNRLYLGDIYSKTSNCTLSCFVMLQLKLC